LKFKKIEKFYFVVNLTSLIYMKNKN